ncbi:MAG TPA: FAD binding domain-containing protein [Myxococcales bacterium]|nr:FAD binding domain-containing protein [Myxococcales bacterium]
MKSFAWIEPADVQGAIEAGVSRGSLFKAGGVDVADRMKEHLEEPQQLVNLRHLRELDFVKVDAHGLRLGPLLTLAALAGDPRVAKSAPALAQAAAAAATPQIRNLATLGGNLAQRPRCWYFRREEFHCRRKGGTECFAMDGQNEMHAVFGNDLCAIVHPSATATALTALGASLVLKGSQGARTVAIDDFFVRPEKDITRENVLQPGELIVEVRVPAQPHNAYVKLMEKQAFDWPLAEAAVRLGADPRVVLGAAAPVPWRAGKAEQVLRGRRLDAALAEQAAAAAIEGAKPLQHNAYKPALLRAAVKRALLAAGGIA